MEDMGPIIDEFLTESYENLDQLDQDFVTLESDPKEDGLLARIFRAIHTLKGTCGFLGFSKLESVAHVGENLLSKLRDRELEVTPETITALLTMGDAIRQMLGCIEQDGNEGEIDYSALVETLTRLQNGHSESNGSNGSNGSTRKGEAGHEVAPGAPTPPEDAAAAKDPRDSKGPCERGPMNTYSPESSMAISLVEHLFQKSFCRARSDRAGGRFGKRLDSLSLRDSSSEFLAGASWLHEPSATTLLTCMSCEKRWKFIPWARLPKRSSMVRR